MKRLIYRDGEWKEVTEPSPRKIYCDSEHCPVSDNCFRHQSNLDIDWDSEVWKKIILEDFDRNGECECYDPIKEDV